MTKFKIGDEVEFRDFEEFTKWKTNIKYSHSLDDFHKNNIGMKFIIRKSSSDFVSLYGEFEFENIFFDRFKKAGFKLPDKLFKN